MILELLKVMFSTHKAAAGDRMTDPTVPYLFFLS